MIGPLNLTYSMALPKTEKLVFQLTDSVTTVDVVEDSGVVAIVELSVD